MRSFLFVPATRPDRFEKALRSRADAVCVDLEDAIALVDKPEGRVNIETFMLSAPDVIARRIVRINLEPAGELALDIELLKSAEWKPDYLMLPKLSSSAQIDAVYGQLGSNWKQVPAIAVLETAAGLEAAAEIASQKDVAAVAFGSGDYSADTGCDMSWDALVYGRGRTVQAAAFGGVAALDGAWLDTKDMAGLRNETCRLPALGFAGRAAIHPDQVVDINAAFTPSAQAIGNALAIIEADKQSRGGVTILNGRMIDAPIVERARRIAIFANQKFNTNKVG